jgi:arylsulfatase
MSLLDEPVGLSSSTILLECVAATVAVLVAAHALAWLALYPLHRRAGWDPTAGAIAISLFFVVVTPLWPVSGAERISTLGAKPGLQQLMVTGAALAMPLLLAVIGYSVAKQWVGKDRARRALATAVLAGPMLGAALLLLFWVQLFHIEGAGSRGSFVAIGICFAGMAFLVVLSRWLSRRLEPGRPALVTLIVVLIAPLAARWSQSAMTQQTTIRAPDDDAGCVLLLTVDTLRTDAISFYGGHNRTPAFDGLLQDSVVFTNARSVSSWTKPAFASIMTGLSPLVHETTGLSSRLPSGAETIAEILQDVGFRTVAIGSNVFLREHFNFHQGFQEYYFSMGSAGDSFGARILRASWPPRYREATTEDLANRAIRWVETRPEGPFFMWLHFFDPHWPYQPPRAFLPSKSAPPRIGTHFDEFESVRQGQFVPSEVEKKWIRDLYEAEVRYVDANVGQFLDSLKRAGLYDSCLVAFTSDHGEEFWEHGGYEHGHTLYDELLRVPLAFKLPSSATVTTTDASVSTESISPSILDVLNLLDDEKTFTSPSLSPWWRAPDVGGQRAPILSGGNLYFEERVSILFDSTKYIHHPGSGREELYDLSRDPSERDPLGLRWEERLEEARRLLQRQTAIYGDIRAALNLRESSAEIDREIREKLRSLGYIQ